MADHVTVEGTRKSIKFQQLLATATIILGVVLLTVASQSNQGEARDATMLNGSLTLAGGAVWSGFMRMARWWQHA